jgi:DNA-binding GntR family transcriptional regulator
MSAHEPLIFVRENMPLGEAVFRALCDALQAGVYRPGDRLREDEVALRLNVSRTPVREAFNRLSAKRLVQSASGRGLIVRSLDDGEVMELYAMREILEGAAAGLAAQYATPPEIEALTDMQARFALAAREPKEMARVNRMFHAAIVRGARNRYLDLVLGDLQDAIALLGATTFEVDGRPATASKEHTEIIAAIASHNSDSAERLARHHIREALRARMNLRTR